MKTLISILKKYVITTESSTYAPGFSAMAENCCCCPCCIDTGGSGFSMQITGLR
ncbi:MAG: hypothetical protein Q8873_02840 [Bacillota bacterium]|nr:hypothetical protein [Bacillota bacterium]